MDSLGASIVQGAKLLQSAGLLSVATQPSGYWQLQPQQGGDSNVVTEEEDDCPHTASGHRAASRCLCAALSSPVMPCTILHSNCQLPSGRAHQDLQEQAPATATFAAARGGAACSHTTTTQHKLQQWLQAAEWGFSSPGTGTREFIIEPMSSPAAYSSCGGGGGDSGSSASSSHGIEQLTPAYYLLGLLGQAGPGLQATPAL